MQTFTPAPSRLEPAGKFVHDYNLAVLNDIFFVFMKKRFGPHRRFQMVDEFHPAFGVNVSYIQRFFHSVNAFLSHGNRPEFFINSKIFFFYQGLSNGRKFPV